MARIILFGGHGKIALLAEPLLAQQGHAVTAVVRNPDHAGDVTAAGAVPLVADIEALDTNATADIVSGYDAIVWSAGAGGGDPARTRAVDRDAAIRVMDAAAQAGVKRFVMVSYFDSSPNHGVDADNPFWHYAEAKAAADEHLRASDLDWTVLGPSALTLEPSTGRIDVATSDSVESAQSQKVAREAVAEVIVAALDDASTIGRTIRFNDGETPIAEAIRA